MVILHFLIRLKAFCIIENLWIKEIDIKLINQLKNSYKLNMVIILKIKITSNNFNRYKDHKQHNCLMKAKSKFLIICSKAISSLN